MKRFHNMRSRVKEGIFMTIKDLSAQTGYSVGTVSRVLNNQPNVSEKARQVILAAADESGFQLNVNAKQLKQQYSTTILVVVKGVSNEMFGNCVEVLQTRALSTRYSLVVDYIEEDANEVQTAVRLCREKKPLGVVFLGGNRDHFLADFDKINVPCVLVTNSAEGLPFENLSSVTSDDSLFARMAIDHMVSLGHRKFAVIGGDPEISDVVQMRYQGCMDAFRHHGISFDPAQDYENARFSYADGYRAAKKLMKRGRNFTALFCMSDVMAIGAIRALRDAGKRVPEDMSVMGLDGLAIGEYTVPKLATVCQAVDTIAETSLDLLLDQIDNKASARHKIVPVYLEWRESARHID